MVWRHPAAWFGLLTLLIPIAIHMLVRQHAEPRQFPTLRFIQASRLASVRRRRLSDRILLAVRLGILALAVTALADPLWQTAARRDAWMARTARAIVIDTSASARGDAGTATREAEREAANTFRSATFEDDDPSVAVRRAAEWLRTAPPARRELVVLSDFQIGVLDASMLAEVPGHVGLRFVRTARTPATRTATGLPHSTGTGTATDTEGSTPIGAGPAGTDAGASTTFALRAPRVTVNARETSVSWLPVESATSPALPALERGPTGITMLPFNLRLQTSAADSAAVAAAARAVLIEGVGVDVKGDGGVTAGRTVTTDARSARAHPITLVVAHGDNSVAAPRDVVPLAAPWMADVARRIADDDTLADVAARASIAAEFPDGDPQAPWITLLRDAAGRPALLAASRRTVSDRTTSEATGAGAAAARQGGAARDSGGTPEGGRPEGGTSELVLVSRLAADSEATALLLRAALRTVGDGREPLREAEVATTTDATLASWQRPASAPPPSDWRDLEGGDRRWLWGAALVLLGVEQLIRRRVTRADEPHEHGYEHAA